MAFKFSQKTKDVMDFIRAYGSLFTICLFVIPLLFAFDLKNLNYEKIQFPWVICLKATGILIIAFPFVLYNWEKARLKFLMYRNKLSGFIIEKQDVTIDIREHGRSATFLHKIYFHEFNRKTKGQHITKFNVSGRIDPMSIKTINCSHHFANSYRKNEIRISYVNDGKKNSNKLFKQNDKFLFFYAVLKDTFTSKVECWEMSVENLCHEYTLHIFLPNNQKIEDVKLVRVEEDKREIPVEGIQPILVQGERQFIVLQIMNLDKMDRYKVIWTKA